ncbi:MAG TPA: M48 family metalloprotease [Acidobacteriaceae bacterium]|nr:M48 family metalloprotease [Acidobacteriaceae bacterium]
MRISNAAVRGVLLGCLWIGACAPGWARFQPVTCKNRFTEQQEIAEGKKVAAQVYQQMPVLPDSSPVSQYIQQLGAKLVSYAPGYKWPYNFHVVASQDINAFALPGGSVFVNLGTIQAADTEAQLAGVMAHEISHVVMRHSTCNLTKQQTYGTLAAIGQLGASILLGGGALGSAVSQGIGLGTGLGFLKMSREDEKQADLLGVGILYDAGYDPRGLPQFFETIEGKYGKGGAQFLSDHPNPGNRTEYVDQEIATLPRRADWKVTSPEFKQIHALAMKEKGYTAKEVQAGVWRGAGRYAAGPGGSAQVISAPGGGQASGQESGTVRLSRTALGIGGRMTSYQGSRFTLNYPAGWQKSEGQDGSVAFAPPNGAGQTGISYGVLIDTASLQGGAADSASLEQATTALVEQLSKQNAGLQQIGEMTSLKVGGQAAKAVELRGQSPVTAGGSALPERDWLVTVARPDGNLNYLVFVSPEPDFATLKPTFSAMAQSFRPH